MSDEGRIPTNLRTLLILEAVGRSDNAMTATEINETIGLPKQTIHRLVTMLTVEGFLAREDDGKRFRPGRRLREIGAGILFASRTHISRNQILREVASEVGETVNYVIPEETGMHYLDRVETDWPFRVQLPRGTNVPFHCTASGKVFMASMSLAARRRFVAGLNLKGWTANTHAEPDGLLEDLANSHRRGYALDNEEFVAEMVALAVPVTDPSGRYIASLAFHGPRLRLASTDILESHLQTMLNGARKLQEALFSD